MAFDLFLDEFSTQPVRDIGRTYRQVTACCGSAVHERVDYFNNADSHRFYPLAHNQGFTFIDADIMEKQNGVASNIPGSTLVTLKCGDKTIIIRERD